MNRSKQWFIHLVLVAMVFIGFSCGGLDGGDPEVFLVRDDEYTFHFQWDEPLVEDRIILVRSVSTGHRDVFSAEAWFFPGETESRVFFIPGVTTSVDAFSVDGTINEASISIDEVRINGTRGNWFFTTRTDTRTDAVIEEYWVWYDDDTGDRHRMENPPPQITIEETSTPGHYILVSDKPVDADMFLQFSLSYTFDNQEDQLLLFKADSLQSRRITPSDIFDLGGADVLTVMILPAEERRNFCPRMRII